MESVSIKLNTASNCDLQHYRLYLQDKITLKYCLLHFNDDYDTIWSSILLQNLPVQLQHCRLTQYIDKDQHTNTVNKYALSVIENLHYIFQLSDLPL